MPIEIYALLTIIVPILGLVLSFVVKRLGLYLAFCVVSVIMCIHAIVASELSKHSQTDFEVVESGEKYKIIFMKPKTVKSLGLVIHRDGFLIPVEK